MLRVPSPKEVERKRGIEIFVMEKLWWADKKKGRVQEDTQKTRLGKHTAIR